MLKPACDKSQSFGLLYWSQKQGFEKKKIKKLKNTVLIHPGINTFWFVTFCDLCWKRPLPTELLCSTWATLSSDFAPCSWPLWSAQRRNSNPFSTKEVKMSPSFSANSPQWVYFFFCLHSKHLIKHLEKLVSLQLRCLPSSPSLVCDLTGSNAELCSWICRQPATTALWDIWNAFFKSGMRSCDTYFPSFLQLFFKAQFSFALCDSRSWSINRSILEPLVNCRSFPVLSAAPGPCCGSACTADSCCVWQEKALRILDQVFLKAHMEAAAAVSGEEIQDLIKKDVYLFLPSGSYADFLAG